MTSKETIRNKAANKSEQLPEFWALWGDFGTWFAVAKKHGFGPIVSHINDCKCEDCLAWEAIIGGPDNDSETTGKWGIFTIEEIEQFIKTQTNT